jgi:AcrR family transcriptional regulator
VPKISDIQRDARRQQILDAALTCFSENGFHQTGMADIVERSCMSHGAVYGYFQSKDDIIEAIADDRRAREAMLNALVQQAETPIEALHALVGIYANWLTDPAGESRRRVSVHGWAEALRSPRVHARVVEGIDIPRSMIVGLVEKAQSMGRISSDLSADAIARALIAVFHGFILQTSWGEKIDIDDCITVIDRMLLGLGNSIEELS